MRANPEDRISIKRKRVNEDKKLSELTTSDLKKVIWTVIAVSISMSLISLIVSLVWGVDIATWLYFS